MDDLLLARYFDYLLLSQIKSGLITNAKQAVYEPPQGFTTEDVSIVYDRAFFAPADMVKMRSAILRGMQMPAIALWRTTEPVIAEKAYGRSVLKRSILVPAHTDSKGNFVPAELHQAPLIDWTFEYHFFAESYFSDFVSRVAQDFIQFDMVRYVELDMSNYIYGFKTRAELMVKRPEKAQTLNEQSGSRSFTVDIPFTFTVTVPFMGSDFAVDELLVYLNGQKIIYLNVKP